MPSLTLLDPSVSAHTYARSNDNAQRFRVDVVFSELDGFTAEQASAAAAQLLELAHRAELLPQLLELAKSLEREPHCAECSAPLVLHCEDCADDRQLERMTSREGADR